MTEMAVLDALYEKLTSAATAGDAAGYSATFIEKGALMPPGSPAVVGQSNIQKWIGCFLRTYSLEVKTFDFDDRVVGDTVAFCRWTATGVYRRSDGQPFDFDQKYVDTILKNSDGQWRFAIHIWSSNTQDPGVWGGGSNAPR